MDEIQKRLDHIKYCIDDARHYNGLYSSSHTELEWLISQVEQLQKKNETYRDFIEQIAGGVYDSPSIPHEEIRSDAIEILHKELK